MIKRLAKCVREYKLPSFLSALFVSLEVVMEVLMPFEMADMLDYGYVGAARGKVSLYKAKECIEKNIPEEEAVERLLKFIEEDLGER